MCGRFALTTPANVIAQIFAVEVLPDLLPRFNVSPTQRVPIVVPDGAGGRELVRAGWGLVPSWSKDDKGAARLINARSETAWEKPSFRAAWKRRRALIPADGFYEWETRGKLKFPHLFQRRDESPFAIAGLWEFWKNPETGQDHLSCSILTTQANGVVAPYHDRMPVILAAQDWDEWLDPEHDQPSELLRLMTPAPTTDWKERPVSTRVNDARKEGPDCQNPPEDAP